MHIFWIPVEFQWAMLAAVILRECVEVTKLLVCSVSADSSV
jgi:hypothetical protein